MFSPFCSSAGQVYGMFDTPVLTNYGMITGMSINGQMIMQENPAISLNSFFERPAPPKSTYTLSCDQVMDMADRQRNSGYVNNTKVQLEESLRLQAETAATLEKERLRAAEIQRQLDIEKERLRAAEIQRQLDVERAKASGKTNIFKRFIDDTMSTISSLSPPASVLTDDNSDESEESDDDNDGSDDSDDNDFDIESTFSDDESVITDESLKASIDKMNGVAKLATCTNCDQCHNGVQSVGCIFMHIDAANDDFVFLIGNNSIDKAYCDYSQKIKKNTDGEKPLNCATKILKKFINLEYDFQFNKFIDIPLKDDKHVHRVFIIKCKIDMKFNKTLIVNEFSNFSLKKMNENLTMFHANKIVNTNGITCNINKRIRKFFELFYIKHVST